MRWSNPVLVIFQRKESMIFKAKLDIFYVTSTVLEVLIIVALAILPLYFESFKNDLITVFIWLALFIITIALVLWASFSIKCF